MTEIFDFLARGEGLCEKVEAAHCRGVPDFDRRAKRVCVPLCMLNALRRYRALFLSNLTPVPSPSPPIYFCHSLPLILSLTFLNRRTCYIIHARRVSLNNICKDQPPRRAVWCVFEAVQHFSAFVNTAWKLAEVGWIEKKKKSIINIYKLSVFKRTESFIRNKKLYQTVSGFLN